MLKLYKKQGVLENMGCFVVTLVTGIATSATRRIVKSNEKKNEINEERFTSKKWSERLKYLELSLYGGSFVLMGEHVFHGELSPFPPFLTAMKDASETVVMLKEMATVGTSMALAIIFVWLIACLGYDFVIAKKRNIKVKK